MDLKIINRLLCILTGPLIKMASERGELGQFFDWLDDFDFYEKIDKEFKEIMSLVIIPDNEFHQKMFELRKKMKWMKKVYDERDNENDYITKILHTEGYFYCVCCNKWKKPLGEACTLWNMPK